MKFFPPPPGGEEDPPGDRAADVPEQAHPGGQGQKGGGAQEDRGGRGRLGEQRVFQSCISQERTGMGNAALPVESYLGA